MMKMRDIMEEREWNLIMIRKIKMIIFIKKSKFLKIVIKVK